MTIDTEKLLDTADLMVASQNYDKAISIYNQIIEVNSQCDEAYLMRGALFAELGQTDKALQDVLKSISIDAEYDGAYLTLAILYKSQGNLQQAIEACRQAVFLNKNNKEAVQNIVQLHEALADQQLASHQAEKAAENYLSAIEYAPANIQLLYKYAFTISKMGDFNRACELTNEILKKNNQHVPTLCLLTAIYEKTGEIEKGMQLSEQLVKQFPSNPSINITYAKYALRGNNQNVAISSLIKALEIADIKLDDRLSMHMLLGKLYDSIADYNKAFLHFEQANNLKYNDYNINDFEKNISTTINYFTKEKYKAITSSTNDSTDIIFILGMPRSGTSLVEQIVSSHSKVYGGGELQYLINMVQTIDKPGGEYPYKLENLTNADLNNYAEEFINTMHGLSPQHQKITDKLPHNFEYIGLIHKLLPNAKIINCLRNPVDTCLSCYFQHFGGYHPYAYNLSHLAQYYQQYSRLMYHWQNELEIPILDVHYENIVQDTEAEVRALLNYLKLDWEDACLEFYKQNRAINTASYTQVNRKIYTGSVNRWTNYRLHINELLDVLT